MSASSFLEVVMYRKFDPTQTEQFFNEANDIVSMVSTVMANEDTNMASKDVYILVERLERARNLLLTVGDRKHIDESKEVM
jgi:hypothetical protein